MLWKYSNEFFDQPDTILFFFLIPYVQLIFPEYFCSFLPSYCIHRLSMAGIRVNHDLTNVTVMNSDIWLQTRVNKYKLYFTLREIIFIKLKHLSASALQMVEIHLFINDMSDFLLNQRIVFIYWKTISLFSAFTNVMVTNTTHFYV